MSLKLISTIAVLAMTSLTAFSQGKYADRFASRTKGTLLGFSVNNASFDTTNNLYPGLIPDHKLSNIGASLHFYKGLTSHLDLGIRLGAVFSGYNKKDPFARGTFHPELEGSVLLKALSDNHLFNPYLTAGIGAGSYTDHIVAFAPVGVGLQVNIFSEAYLFLQANYRVALNTDYLDHHTFYALGVAIPVGSGTAKIRTPKDTDGDGVADMDDACPELAGLIALNGCPDKDGDGITDKDDKCPDVAGTAKYNGCPIPDTDGDGINDENDQCIDVAGVAKYNGCPVPDTDGDGVNDEQDKCPTVAGPASNSGCPVITVETQEQLKSISKGIYFETGKDVLKQQSLQVLDQIVDIMDRYPAYNIEISGHTDNVGTEEKNMRLSKDRANAVKTYLASKGVSADRMNSEGYGFTRPISDNSTADGRANNRRVTLELKMRD